MAMRWAVTPTNPASGPFPDIDARRQLMSFGHEVRVELYPVHVRQREDIEQERSQAHVSSIDLDAAMMRRTVASSLIAVTAAWKSPRAAGPAARPRYPPA